MTNLLTNETMTNVSRKAMLHGVSVDLCTRIAGLISPSRMDMNTVSAQVGYEQKCHFFDSQTGADRRSEMFNENGENSC